MLYLLAVLCLLILLLNLLCWRIIFVLKSLPVLIARFLSIEVFSQIKDIEKRLENISKKVSEK